MNRAIGDGSPFCIGEVMETWPLWQCLSVKALADLIQLQWKLYNLKLDLLIDGYKEVEDVDEIDRLMRQKPRYVRRMLNL